ncbi:MAG: hypothetical protein ACO2PN_22165 [Pyrobaculum sp.]
MRWPRSAGTPFGTSICTGPSPAWVLHPLNVRLAPEDIVYIINRAGDKALIYR